MTDDDESHRDRQEQAVTNLIVDVDAPEATSERPPPSPRINNVSQSANPGDYMDLNTGAPTTRVQSIQQVEAEEPTANRWQRFMSRAGAGSSIRSSSLRNSVRASLVSAGGEAASAKQYRIISRSRPVSSESAFRRCITHTHDGVSDAINRYMMWTFRASFTMVNLASGALFMGLTILFSIFLWCVKLQEPECLVTGQEDGEITWVDTFHLSWTTFSTVGYGIIAPGLSSTTQDGHRCFVTNLLMAIEAFVGVLFAGVTGAIIYAKVARVQSTAPILFSDPMVVRFGDGCREQLVEGDGDDETEDEPSSSINTRLPCPVLEFRVLNTMWNEEDGEILNAEVNLVASRLEHPDDVDKRLCEMIQQDRKANPKTKRPRVSFTRNAASSSALSRPAVTLVGRARNVSRNLAQRVHQNIVAATVAPQPVDALTMSKDSDSPSSEQEPQPINLSKMEEEKQLQIIEEAVKSELDKMSSIMSASKEVVVDEGADRATLPKQIFCNLNVETDFHPFFKRTWIIKHVCNEHSPLLPTRIRKRILKNNGYWPEDLNSHEEVRKAINFFEIIVSFSGVANDSGSSVYTQRVYSYADMAIGYAFANLFAKDKETGKIMVDQALLNDVRPQASGGAEPIKTTDVPDFMGYSVEPEQLDATMLDPIVEGEDEILIEFQPNDATPGVGETETGSTLEGEAS